MNTGVNDGATATRLHGRDGNRDRCASAIGREVVLRFVDLDDKLKNANVPTHVAIRDGDRTAEFVETAATRKSDLL